MRWSDLIDRIRQALDEPPPSLDEILILRRLDGTPLRPFTPPPGVQPRQSAALLLLFPRHNEWYFPLTVRSSRVTTHRGEVSLPGGGIDPIDNGATGAALREAHEEIGIDPGKVEVLGALTTFYIPPSNNYLTPVVGVYPEPFEPQHDPEEVDAVFTVPLAMLFDPAIRREEIWERNGMQMRVPFFALNGYKVWGATALLLSEFVARLRRVGWNGRGLTT
ncbi:NUDIX hydrolase [Chloroflexus sp.]|uniref:NUDIX hydrolase n=1 Tax=Chloroflexus sp. TaxID=1904827 RepID=UPI002602439E|nr:CoA pyrophosphatase [uncultured Chloroflexus sp.]